MRLNEPKKYRLFPDDGTASIVEQMPKLVTSGRTAMPFYRFMERRLEVRNSKKRERDEELISNWNNNYFFTIDGALRSPDESLIIAYDALGGINPDSPLVDGALNLSGVNLKGINGKKFTKVQLEKMILGQGLTEKQTGSHKVWIALARDNAKLAKDYARMVFADNKQRFGYDTNMSVYLGPVPSIPTMRSWVVDGLDGWAVADGGVSLDDDDGRLVGELAPEAQSAAKK